MNNIQLQNLKIDNFKGIKSLSMNFENLTNIVGDNATGKTSIYDAWLWLLFDKDSTNRKDFEIKPIDKSGESNHDVETVVEATLKYKDKSYVFKKTYSEKWTKKRSQADLEFTGHTIKYFVNYSPVKRGEYNTELGNIMKENIFKILSDTGNFNKILSWQERRTILFELAEADTSDSNLAKSLGYARLSVVFEDIELDKYIQKIKSEQSEINKELSTIPIRIDEIDKIKNIVVNPNINLPKELELLRSKLAALSGKEDNTEEDKLISKINELRLQESKNQSALFQMISDLQNEKKIPENLQVIKSNQESLNSLMSAKREDWKKVYGQTYNRSDKCPTCNQKLPDKDIENAKEIFNNWKAGELKRINEDGLKMKEEFKLIEKSIKDKTVLINHVIEKNKGIDIEILKLNTEKTSEAIEIPRLSDKLDTMRQVKKQNAGLFVSGTEKDTLELGIRDLEQQIANEKLFTRSQDRKNELKATEKKMSKVFLELQNDLREVEKFIKAKVYNLEEAINEQFEIVKFKLFDQQINGAILETCITTIDGVPYSDLNGASKITAGLDIIKTLQIFYDLQAPIFIDNRESITKIQDMNNTQIVNLIVDPNELKLRVM